MRTESDTKSGMAGRKILICTTFREFNGNSNDKIQRLFLSTLKRQTYQNYLVVATTFGEKNVESALREEKVPHVIFAGDAGEYRFSSTQVMENGISLIDKSKSYIIIWTTCDDLLEDRFFERIVNTMTPFSCCTSLPHIVYRNIEDYKKKKIGGRIYGGIDLICFDGDVFLNSEARSAIRDYPNKGWGLFEYFLSGIGRVFCQRMYNAWPAQIEAIRNDRKANNETLSYFDSSTTYNKKKYVDFIRKYSLKGDVYSSILCYKTSFRYVKVWSMIFIMVTIYRIQGAFFKSRLFRSISPGVKKIFRKIIGKRINDHA